MRDLNKEGRLLQEKFNRMVINEKEIDIHAGKQDVKQSLANNYIAFAKRLGDNAKDPKFVAAIKSLKDDAPVNTSDMTIKCTDLKPTQNEVVMDKSLLYPLTKADNAELYLKGGTVSVAGKDIVTSGGGKYIIDGHHRWSQLFCINPDAKITSLDLTDIKDPFAALKATQLGIVGQIKKVPKAKGGGINLFTVSERVLKQYVVDNIKDDVVEVFKKYGKGNTPEEIADYIWGNVQTLKETSKPVKGAPPRELMPQTDDAPNWTDTAVHPAKTVSTESYIKLSSREKLLREADKELRKIRKSIRR